MRGTPIPNEMSIIFPDRTAADVFDKTCVGFPHNTKPGRDLDNCCWRWINDGD